MGGRGGGARCETIRPGTGAKYIVDSGTDVKYDLFPLLVKSSLKHHCGSVSMMAEDIRRILNELECAAQMKKKFRVSYKASSRAARLTE